MKKKILLLSACMIWLGCEEIEDKVDAEPCTYTVNQYALIRNLTESNLEIVVCTENYYVGELDFTVPPADLEVLDLYIESRQSTIGSDYRCMVPQSAPQAQNIRLAEEIPGVQFCRPTHRYSGIYPAFINEGDECPSGTTPQKNFYRCYVWGE